MYYWEMGNNVFTALQSAISMYVSLYLLRSTFHQKVQTRVFFNLHYLLSLTEIYHNQNQVGYIDKKSELASGGCGRGSQDQKETLSVFNQPAASISESSKR